jgi:hypothetical protein
MTPRHPHVPNFDIPISCAAHDAWTLAYLPAWYEDDIEGVSAPSYVNARGRDLLRDHAGWEDGQLRDLRCKALAGEEDWDIASAMFPLVESSIGDDLGLERRNEVISRFERLGIETKDKGMYHYGSEYGLEVFVTSQLAMSMSVTNTTMRDLHGGEGLEIVERR